MAVGINNRLLCLFLIAAVLNNILFDKTALHGCKAFFSTIVHRLQADGLISANSCNICHLPPGNRVVMTEWDGLLVITGDFNIDLLRPEQPQVKQYIDMLESLNLHQHVEQPTRTTAISLSRNK